MGYISRAMESVVGEVASEYAVILVTGPRQVGKSTMLMHMLSESLADREHVSLDDLNERKLAQEDPAMFFQLHTPPLLIDEVQYAPELFSQIKLMVDAGAEMGSFWLTGSQQFHLMELAGETLAGRIAVLSLSSLTQGERAGSVASPFTLDLAYWKHRQSVISHHSMRQVFSEIHQGAMPAVDSGKVSNLDVFYGSYVQTYIERDVRRLLGNVDAIQFADFMRATVARCAQMLNVASVAQDVGIRPEKAKEWLAVLERSGIIFYLHPYSNNQLKRTVKAPKLYCHDTGLMAYLTKWSTPETIEAGAVAGAFLENFVVAEIWKSYLNAGKEPPLYYYRDHDAKEIDLVIEVDGELHPLEIKKTASPNKGMVNSFKTLDRASIPRGMGAIICASEKVGALDADTLIIPVGLI